MKRIIVLLAVTCLLFSCSKPEAISKISGKINFTSGTPSGNIYIGLHTYSPYQISSFPLQLLEQQDPAFELKVKPGKYTLAVYALEYEKYTTHLFVPDNQSRIHLEITLPPQGIHPDFKEVILSGRFCNWNWQKGAPMTRRGDVWVSTDTSLVKTGEPYKFYVDDLFRNDMRQKKTKVVRDWAFLDNLHQGGEIIFDPALYLQPRQEPTAQITGDEFTQDFLAISKELEAVESEYRDLPMKMQTMPPEEQKTAFESVMSRYTELGQKYKPLFQQFFLEEKLRIFTFGHPVFREFRQHWQAGKADSVQLNQLYQSEKYQAYFSELRNLLEQIDPQSQLLDGEFIFSANFLEQETQKHPFLLTQQKMPADYFDKFYTHFLEKSPNDACRENVIWGLASNYARQEQPEKAEFYLAKLESEYPNSNYVKRGHTQETRNSLKIRVGVDAPLFAVQTITGDSIRLADLKGKFVFIDFWGTWCGPCRGEIPNMKKLAREIPNTKLQVIGLASDDLKTLKDYIKQEKIEYPNAIAGKELIARYGITGWPTTLLISPSGKIVAKNLRGEDLTRLVTEKMAGAN